MVVRALVELVRGGPPASAALVFLSGAVAQDAHAVGEAARAACPGLGMVVVSAAGVLTEDGDVEGESAASIALVRGGAVSTFGIRGGAGEILQTLSSRVGERRDGVALFVTPEALPRGALDDRPERFPRVRLLGAGTPEGRRPVVVSSDGRIEEVDAAGVVFGGLSVGLAVSPGARLIGRSLHMVTEVSGSLVSQLDGRPALEVLSQLAGSLEGRPLVMVVRGGASDDPVRSGRLRPIRGIHPERQAIMLTEPIQAGESLGLVAVEPSAARAGLEAAAGELARGARGAMPELGLLVSCAGRGAQFYGTSGTEPRVLRQRFPGVPFAGMFSSFELAVQDGRLVHHVFTSVIGLFSRPS